MGKINVTKKDLKNGTITKATYREIYKQELSEAKIIAWMFLEDQD